jgi:transcriptional regulator with XRE-family HTH domain
MKARKILKELMKLRGHTYQSLASKLGYANPSGVSRRIGDTGDMSVSTLLKFLEAMDCELVIKSKLDDKTIWKVDDTEKTK